MSIADSLLTLNTVRQDLITAIESKGVVVGDVGLNSLATKINEITTGSGGGTTEEGQFWVRPNDWTPRENITDRCAITAHILIKPTDTLHHLNLYVKTNSGNFTVDWGDGVIETYAYNKGIIVHDYSAFIGTETSIKIIIKAVLTNAYFTYYNLFKDSSTDQLTKYNTNIVIRELELNGQINNTFLSTSSKFNSLYITNNSGYSASTFLTNLCLNVTDSIEVVGSISQDVFRSSLAIKYLKFGTITTPDYNSNALLAGIKSTVKSIYIETINFLFNGTIFPNTYYGNYSNIEYFEINTINNFYDETYNQNILRMFDSTYEPTKSKLKHLVISNCTPELSGFENMLSGLHHESLVTYSVPEINSNPQFIYPDYSNYFIDNIIDITFPYTLSAGLEIYPNNGLNIAYLGKVKHLNLGVIPLYTNAQVYGCENLESITAIGTNYSSLAFYGCYFLTSINMDFANMFNLSSLRFENIGLSTDELNRIFTLLPGPVGGWGQATIKNMPGLANADLTLLTSKGWEIVS